MADLSFLNEIPGTVDAINRYYEESRKPRTHLGLSQAGHECKRFLWYMHQGEIGTQPEGRVLRLFQLGNLVEDQVIADLRAAGMPVVDQQREVVFTQDGVKLVGHIDGIITGLIEAPVTPHLFECKSASKKKYEELIKAGSYRGWNEIYFWQTQFYMLGLNLTRAVVFVYCKDDSRLYMERIKLDKEATIEKLRSIFEAINSTVTPDRSCPKEDYYKKKFCQFREICFHGKQQSKAMGWAW